YAGWPWLGILAMVWFTLVGGVFLSWATLRSGSVWPSVIGHAAINGIAGIAIIPQVLGVEPNLVLGPYPSGFLGSIGFTLVALGILFHPRALLPMAVVDSTVPPVDAAG
ncbi:MAG TPA: CPBP family glutamic-type intramembrane protease, partial [Levilinea sp.]|nr:CPBP family glutamic-type intramembrane protease [Levilinea sp.]